MKQIFLLLFTLFSFQVYALDIKSFKDAKCEKVDMGDAGNNIVSNMYNCTYKSNVAYQDVYFDVIDIVGKEIISKNNFKSSKAKISFENKLNDIKTKKYDEYVIKEDIKDGVAYIVSRSLEQSAAEISTNMAVMDEYYSFIIMKENNTVKLTISSFKGNEYIEANKTFLE